MREEPPRTVIAAASVEADINVTPLVDVCLVLLIIFMVVTPMIREGVQLDLPETATPAAIPEHERQVVVAIDRTGRLFVSDVQVAPEALVATLGALLGGDATHAVVVRGDRTLPYGDVRAVFKLVNDAGFTKASLVTLRRGTGIGSQGGG